MAHDHDGSTGPRGPAEQAALEGAIADVVRTARRALVRDGQGGPGEAPALRAAVARAAAASAAAGLRADDLLAALDAALARAGAGSSARELERQRGAVAALALRAHVARRNETE